MPRLLVLSILLVACIASANGQSIAWSLAHAKGLKRHPNLATSPGLSPQERQQLWSAVENLVRPHLDGGDIASEAELHRLAGLTRVMKVDLNGDGSPEYILQAWDMKIGCGATGNCAVWVFQKKANRVELLLDTRDAEGIGGDELVFVRMNRSRGFRDILLAAHDSASEKSIDLYQFDGQHYKATRCYVATWVSVDLKPLAHPDISPCPR